MRIATWGVNGVRTRLPYLLHWLRCRNPDVVALQKIDCYTREFPATEFCNAGYNAKVHGKRSRYDHGVAILSRRELPKPRVLHRALPGQETCAARLLTVDVAGLSCSSIYAPYGNPCMRGKRGAIKYKVDWLNAMNKHIRAKHGSYSFMPSVLCGDFNVIVDGPASSDIMHTKEEKTELNALRAMGFEDLYRRSHPNDDGFNFGLLGKDVFSRLYLIFGTEDVADCVQDAYVDLEYRKEIEGHQGTRGAPLIVDIHTPWLRE